MTDVTGSVKSERYDGRFVTQRTAGRSFLFDIFADSHFPSEVSANLSRAMLPKRDACMFTTKLAVMFASLLPTRRFPCFCCHLLCERVLYCESEGLSTLSHVDTTAIFWRH